MKQFLKRALSVLVLLALVCSGVLFLTRALAMTEGPEKNGSFLKEDRDYDVLLFGSSHMVNGIYPMELWKDYGITAYNLSGHGAGLAASYWTMRLATQYHKPRVAVLDVLFAQSGTTEMEIGLAHELLDPFPLSREKILAVRDLYPSKAQQAELLFPFDVYHNRWKELDGDMVRRGLTGYVERSHQKGAQARVEVQPLDAAPLIPQTQEMEQQTLGLQYIEKFVRYCQDRDMVPVLTYIPCEISQEWQESCNAALALGRELGALVLDMQYMDLLDHETDWYDQGGHVNPLGAQKITACLGDFLKTALDLPDHRQDKAWQQDYEAYQAELTEKYATLETLPQFLALAAVGDVTLEISWAPGTDPGELLTKLLDRLGNRVTMLEEPGKTDVTVTVPGIAQKNFSWGIREEA